MAHATMKLAAGVNQNKTPALNEAAFSETNLIRFMPDKSGLGLVQKLGGWKKFYPSSIGTTIRALWAWQDSSPEKHLAVGSQTESTKMVSGRGNGAQAIFYYDGPRIFTTGSTITVTGFKPEEYNGIYQVLRSTPGELIYTCAETGVVEQYGEVSTGDSLYVVTNSSRVIVTPTLTISEPQTALSTVQGSPRVTIKDRNSSVANGDCVYVKTQISVGGLIIFGSYPTAYLSDDKFTIVASNVLGYATPAEKTLVDTGFLPRFQFVKGSAEVTVTLPDHGYSTGDTFPILIPVYNGSLKLEGNYLVTLVDGADAKDKFTIQAERFYGGDGKPEVILNNGVAFYEYHRSSGPLPTSSGYGVGGYGCGGYGVGSADGSAAVTARGAPLAVKDWSLDNWADELIACPVGGGVYHWNPLLGFAQATLLPNAPMLSDGAFVAMPQRQIVTWASTFNGVQDPLLVRWCDINNYSSWIATATNQAGSYRISKGSRIVGGIQGPQQGFIWTDIAIWAMQYSGLPLVYSFTEIGSGCGLIGRKAAGSMNGIVFWMSQSQFFMLGGSGIQPIHCPIWDVIFQDIDQDNLDKIRFAANSNFSEISWYYPTKSSNGEVSKYVKYNTQLDAWDFGSLDRTAWINQSIYGPPIGAGLSNFIYQHEVGLDADGQPMNSWFQTGYAQLGEGEYKMFVDQVWPDFKWDYYGQDSSAELELSFFTADYPGDKPRQHGPYLMNKNKDFLSPRFRGRLVSIKVGSNDLASFWRIGAMRYRFTPDGKF